MTALSFNEALAGTEVPTYSGGIKPLGIRPATCVKHGDYETEGKGLLSSSGNVFREIWAKCPGCKRDDLEAEEAQRKEAEAALQRARQDAMLQSSSLPKRFIGKTLENYKAESDAQRKAWTAASEYAKHFNTNRGTGDGLLFSGMPGTGKSHLAAGILQAVMPGTVGLYCTCMDVIQMVRETWRKDSDRGEREVMRIFSSTPLLVIDEVGVQYGTDGEKTILFELFDRRYRDVLPTIILTNQDKEGLKTYLGDRIYDRLTQTSRWIAFDWPSYRATARKEAHP